MLTITSRLELNRWSGFEVCGGESRVDYDLDFRDPALRIARCELLYTDDLVDARRFAQVVRLSNGGESARSEQELQDLIQYVTHGRRPNWKLVAFRVFPDSVELRYEKNGGYFHLVRIEKQQFRMDIEVPATNNPNGPSEMFFIEIRQDGSGEFSAWIRRSGDPDVSYKVLYDKTFDTSAPKPTSKFLQVIVEKLFLGYYKRKLSYLERQYNPFCRMYLEICQSTPILSTIQK